MGLHKLRAIGVQRCIIRTDSKIVTSQIEKECIARDETLEKYGALIRRMGNYFMGFTIEHIESSKNTKATELAKAAARKTTLPPDVFFQIIENAYVKTVELEPRLVNITKGEDWRAPIMAYLCHYYEP
jgi:hypothetical protein